MSESKVLWICADDHCRTRSMDRRWINYKSPSEGGFTALICSFFWQRIPERFTCIALKEARGRGLYLLLRWSLREEGLFTIKISPARPSSWMDLRIYHIHETRVKGAQRRWIKDLGETWYCFVKDVRTLSRHIFVAWEFTMHYLAKKHQQQANMCTIYFGKLLSQNPWVGPSGSKYCFNGHLLVTCKAGQLSSENPKVFQGLQRKAQLLH